MPGKCSFKLSWLDINEYQIWLRQNVNDKYKATCAVCKSDFDISNIGITAVKRHATGQKHVALATALQKGTQTTFRNLSPNNNEPKNTAHVQQNAPSHGQPSAVNESNSSNTPSVETNKDTDCVQQTSSTNQTRPVLPKPVAYLQQRADVTKAEIYWSINRVVHHASTRAAGKDTKLFALMFSDSQIAAQMAIQKDKLAYTITYGLGPYFRQELLNVVQQKTILCLSFDESINKVAQKAQMDVIVRFWSDDENGVCTRYLTSVFPDECTAVGLMNAIKAAVKDFKLNFANIVQLAMDGPNVNVKLYNDLLQLLRKDSIDKMLDTSSCSLHIVHNAYKTAHNRVRWDIHGYLRSTYYLFKDFPTRRAVYKRLNDSELFPLKFCSIRWVENGNVIKRAIEILPNIKKYVDHVKRKPPKTHNYDKVSEALKNDFLEPRLHFMLSVNNDLLRFLIEFQSDVPLMPFLYEDLRTLLKNIGTRFLQKMTFISKNIPGNLVEAKNVNIGFGAKEAIKKLSLVNQVRFKEECRSYLQALYEKLLQKCPFKNNVVKGASCLSPRVMLDEEKLRNRMDLILPEFVKVAIFSGEEADVIKREWVEISTKKMVKEELEKFSRSRDKIDLFHMRLIAAYPELFSKCTISFVQIVCSLFHGNAAVERSFSFNKECLIENLKEDSLIAQRYVLDHMKQLNFDFEKIDITKSMISYFHTSGTKRNEALKAKKQSTDEDVLNRQRMTSEVKVLEFKKKKLLAEKEEELDFIETNIKYLQSKLNNKKV